MSFPLYIFYELLIRLSEIKPEVGTYISSVTRAGSWRINTSTGFIPLTEDILSRQFHNPALITPVELNAIAAQFKPDQK